MSVLVPVGPKQGLEQSWHKAVADGINAINAGLDLSAAALAAQQGAGPPIGTGVVGQVYYDTTNHRLWRSNGLRWVFDRAYDATKRAGVVLTAAGQLIGAGASVTINWTAETSDVDGWITAPGTTLVVPAGWGGCYTLTCRTAGSISSSSDVEITTSINGTALFNSAGPLANALRSHSHLAHGLAPADTMSFVIFNGSAVGITFTSVLVLDWLYL